jgi:hypothetical protein
MSTGESWHELMYDCARPKSITFECNENVTYEKDIKFGKINGCGNPAAAFIYFISFMVMVSFIFLNLFIAIIIERYNMS